MLKRLVEGKRERRTVLLRDKTQNPILELSVKAIESGEDKDMVVRLLLNLAAPVPR